MSIFVLPDLGEGLQEAELVAWHVAEGDHVVADQPLVSVETEKAVVEVPSPQSGRIARLRAQPGERVKVGAALVEFDEGPRADTGTVVGELAAATAPAARPTEVAPAGAAAVRATPAVRALAQRLGVDLKIVAASGPGGAVTSADVERAARTLTEAGPAEPLAGVRRARLSLNAAMKLVMNAGGSMRAPRLTPQPPSTSIGTSTTPPPSPVSISARNGCRGSSSANAPGSRHHLRQRAPNRLAQRCSPFMRPAAAERRRERRCRLCLACSWSAKSVDTHSAVRA